MQSANDNKSDELNAKNICGLKCKKCRRREQSDYNA